MFIHEGLSVPTHKDEYLAHWPSTLSLLSYCSFVYWVVLCIDPFSRHSGLIDVTESCLFTEVCVRMRFTYLAAGFRILPQEIWHKDAIEHHFGLLSACLWTNERKHQPVSWPVKPAVSPLETSCKLVWKLSTHLLMWQKPALIIHTVNYSSTRDGLTSKDGSRMLF